LRGPCEDTFPVGQKPLCLLPSGGAFGVIGADRMDVVPDSGLTVIQVPYPPRNPIILRRFQFLPARDRHVIECPFQNGKAFAQPARRIGDAGFDRVRPERIVLGCEIMRVQRIAEDQPHGAEFLRRRSNKVSASSSVHCIYAAADRHRQLRTSCR
jgi:hypothetical protein